MVNCNGVIGYITTLGPTERAKMMPENPYGDGKIRSHTDAIIRASVVALAVVIVWNAPYAWYWRTAIFIGIMFVVGIIYPTIQKMWAKRRR